MLDKSPLVRKQAIEDVVALLKKDCDPETRARLVGLLGLMALDDKFKNVAERVVYGLHDLWLGKIKIEKKGAEHEDVQKRNKKLAKAACADIQSIIQKKDMPLEALCKLVHKALCLVFNCP